MEEQDLTLANAYKQFRQNETPSIGGCLNWIAITHAFMEDRRGLRYRASTRSHYQFACNGLLELMSADEPPTNGPGLQKQFFDAYLSDLDSGSWGRKRNLENLGIVLRYAVEQGGAAQKWVPMIASDRQSLIGPADSAESKLRPPVKPEQLSYLLDEIESMAIIIFGLQSALLDCSA